MRALCLVLRIAFCLALTRTADAATRTLCAEIVLLDPAIGGRSNCSTTGDPGHRRACRDTAYVDASSAVGFEVKVWDNDFLSVGNDDLCGSFVTTAPGQQCFTFEWENGYCGGGSELQPDLYLTIENRVWATTGINPPNPRIIITQANGSIYPAATTRDIFQANDCAGTCNIGSFFVHGSLDDYGIALLGLDSAQRALEIYRSTMDDLQIKLEYPSNEPTLTAGICGAFTRDWIKCRGGTTPQILLGANGAHEVGHVLQRQLFEQDSLTDDCSLNGASHFLTSVEFESCATTEGWADYVAAVAWWNPDDSASRPVLWGFDFEDENPCSACVCSVNKGIEGMVARSFWDLDDKHNEGPGLLDLNCNGIRETPVDSNGDGFGDYDLSNLTTFSIASNWDSFPDGTANHKDREPQADNGTNMKDYDAVVNVTDQTFFDHNCMTLQDPN